MEFETNNNFQKKNNESSSSQEMSKPLQPTVMVCDKCMLWVS